MANSKADVGAMRRAALELLARREQSAPELVRKLARRFEDEEGARQLVAELGAQGLQCDHRFAQNFVSSRIRTGHGPIKIAAELGQRYGLSQEQARAAVDDDQWRERWSGAAEQLLAKKSGPGAPLQQARAMRLLWQRGFTREQAEAAWHRHQRCGTGK